MSDRLDGVWLPLAGGVDLVDPGGDPLVTHRDGRVMFVVLNASGRRNAVSQAMWRRLIAVFADLEHDATIHTVVLLGAGGRAFCAGADISEFGEVYASPASTRAYNELVRTAQLAIERSPRVTVAMIEGACVGAGLGIALSCDLRLAAESAFFAVPPARLGIAYSPEDTLRLVTQLGVAAARELLLTARRVDAAEAQRLGIVNHVVEDATLHDFTREYLQEHLLRWSADALASIKSILRGVSPAPQVDLDALRSTFDDRFDSPAFRAAFQAFLVGNTKGKH